MTRFHLASILALSLAAACLPLSGCKPASGTAAAPPPPPEVSVMTLQPQDVPVDYGYVGQTEASQRVELRARVEGFLLMRAFEEGKPIKKGDLLFQIDRRPFEVAFEEADSRLEQANATLVRVEKDYARYKELLAAGGATQKEFDDSTNELAQARANLRFAEAQKNRAELDLGYTDILAPFDGVIGLTRRDPGSYLDPRGDSLLGTAIQTDPIYVSFSISEREVLAWKADVASGRIRTPERDQLKVAVVLVDGTRYDKEGKLNFVDIAVDATTGTARLRAELPNPEDKLKPGQFVRALLIGNVRVGALAIPQRSVIQTPNGPICFLVGPDNKVQVRPLKLGTWNGDHWIVESGLAAGDRIVVDGVARVQPGIEVRTIAADSSPAAAPAAQAPAQNK
jgi:membrane fusion protein (multidrug efflux system)